jgi:hypothetical protein
MATPFYVLVLPFQTRGDDHYNKIGGKYLKKFSVAKISSNFKITKQKLMNLK